MANPGKFSPPAGVRVFDASRLGLNNDHDSITVRINGTVLEKHGYNMPTSERRSWNRTADGNHDATFQLAAASPGTRQDGSNYGTSILSDAQAVSILTRLDRHAVQQCVGERPHCGAQSSGANQHVCQRHFHRHRDRLESGQRRDLRRDAL